MGSETRHIQIQASGDQGVSFEEVFELSFEDTEFPRQMRARKAFPIAGMACKVWRRNAAFRKSNTVVQVRALAGTAEEVGRRLVVKGLDGHNLDFILQKMFGHQRILSRGRT